MNLIFRCASCLSIFWLLSALSLALAAEPKPSDVVCLLEENAAELLPKLTNPGGDQGTGEVENKLVFAGKSGVKISFYQRYCNFIDGWAHKIRETPKEGEYRYLRFAWKSEGLTGIMLQLHDDKDWHIRYTSGANKFGWESRTVSAELPEEWTIVTIDLFKDFGDREIHGIALTAFDGTAGYFDHIYLGRSIEALDAIDATGQTKGAPLKLEPDEIEKRYKELSSPDASKAYQAFWTLAAGDASVRELLAKRVSATVGRPEAGSIATWLKELDDTEFSVREAAANKLKSCIPLPRKEMEAELAVTKSAEVRYWLETILKNDAGGPNEADRAEQKVRRILQILAERTK